MVILLSLISRAILMIKEERLKLVTMGFMEFVITRYDPTVKLVKDIRTYTMGIG